ncbi:MAG: hypothetical protein IT452_17990 [Planctomycetia bacterium]|nr:hypothetical protein [Planctomycetia bacterium]
MNPSKSGPALSELSIRDIFALAVLIAEGPGEKELEGFEATERWRDRKRAMRVFRIVDAFIAARDGRGDK